MNPSKEEFMESVRKMSDLIRSHRENNEESHLKAVEILDMHDKLVDYDICPTAAAELFTTAIMLASETLYAKEVEKAFEDLKYLVVRGLAKDLLHVFANIEQDRGMRNNESFAD